MPAPIASLWENVTANMVATAVTSSTFLLIVFLLSLVVWAWVKRNKSGRLRRELEGLLKDANDAIHDLLNGLAGTSYDLAKINQAYNKWDSDTRDKLERLRREKTCTAWEVDHFKVLGTFELVRADSVDHAWLKGVIAEKARHLKRVARRLEDRAERLWPF